MRIAEIVDNIVVRVTEVVDPEITAEWLAENAGGVWVAETGNGVPNVGFTYDEGLDAFIPPKPSEDAVLDEETFSWILPNVDGE
jgi:hypothetical protein